MFERGKIESVASRNLLCEQESYIKDARNFNNSHTKKMDRTTKGMKCKMSLPISTCQVNVQDNKVDNRLLFTKYNSSRNKRRININRNYGTGRKRRFFKKESVSIEK